MDSLAQSTGSLYWSDYRLACNIANNSMTSPWGMAITVTVNSASSYTIAIPATPSNVCPLVITKLKAIAILIHWFLLPVLLAQLLRRTYLLPISPTHKVS